MENYIQNYHRLFSLCRVQTTAVSSFNTKVSNKKMVLVERVRGLVHTFTAIFFLNKQIFSLFFFKCEFWKNSEKYMFTTFYTCKCGHGLSVKPNSMWHMWNINM